MCRSACSCRAESIPRRWRRSRAGSARPWKESRSGSRSSPAGQTTRCRRLRRSRRTTDCRTMSAACPRPSSSGTSHESWQPWISRRSTASTPGSPARRRQSEGTRSSCPGLAATSCSAAIRSSRDSPRGGSWPDRRGASPAPRALLRMPCAYLAGQRLQPKLAGLASYWASIEGMYFLSRGLFLPQETCPR